MIEPINILYRFLLIFSFSPSVKFLYFLLFLLVGKHPTSIPSSLIVHLDRAAWEICDIARLARVAPVISAVAVRWKLIRPTSVPYAASDQQMRIFINYAITPCGCMYIYLFVDHSFEWKQPYSGLSELSAHRTEEECFGSFFTFFF